MKAWRITWAIWSAVVLASFAILEWLGIRAEQPGQKQRNTLSSFLRSALGIAPAHWRRYVLGPLFGVITGWFFLHILFGIWP